MKTWLIGCLAMFVCVQGVLGRTVGIWNDARSHIREGMLQTLRDEGWEPVILSGRDLSNEEKLAELDVVFLPAGWNAYFFADFHARRALVKFTAGGKGLLAGAFRGGHVRTANRPFFPEVGVTYNRVNGPWIWGFGDSELAQAIDEPITSGGWDHMVVDVGPDGHVFAVSGADPVGVYGEVYGGRHLLFGAFIGIDAVDEPMRGTPRRALLAMLDWLASAPERSDTERAAHQKRADIDFLRRELLLDWTLNERGPDRSPGIVPAIRDRLAIPLESRLYRLQYMSGLLPGRHRDRCLAEAEILERTVRELDERYAAELAAVRARVANMSLEDLLSENPYVHGRELASLVEAVPGKTDEERQSMLNMLQHQQTYASKELAAYLHGDEIRERLMPEREHRDQVARTDAVIADLWPSVETVKTERLAAARERDRNAIPSLIEASRSEDSKIRREAVIELGRIGEPGSRSLTDRLRRRPSAAQALIACLQDSDEQVRTHAVIGLGWMQSREAVPDLIGLAEHDDPWMRRRATQALGQIGDARAIPVLISNMDDPDVHVAENAILALGWLKAGDAVPALLQRLSDDDSGDQRIRQLNEAAVRALGNIGDPAALPALEKLAKEADDYPILTRAGQRVRLENIYSPGLHGSRGSLGMEAHAELAIKKINGGGRHEIGVSQADFLGDEDNFYALTRRFNALAGRTGYYRVRTFDDDPAALWAYLWEAGFTGLHHAWGNPFEDSDAYIQLLDNGSDFDMVWIDVTPGAERGLVKSWADIILTRYRDLPAFQGFWSEETYPCTHIPADDFEKWLTERYGADFQAALGLAADYDLSAVHWSTWSDDDFPKPLKTEFLRLAADRLLESWRESQEWMHGFRKGSSLTFSVSDAQPVKYAGVTARAGEVIDVNGPQTYQSFGRFNSFFMEMHKNGEARPVMSEFYNWYSPSPAHDVRGFAQHLMHGECYYNFVLDHIFAQASHMDMWSWDETRWDNARKIFLKARDIREYLAVPESKSNVALVLSDLSTLAFDPVNLYVGGLRQRWMQHQTALWTALNQSRIPTDVIWTETLTPEKLARYRVLVLAAARILTDSEAAMLRDWVAGGGTLIASGTTSLFTEWAEQRDNYQLADLFGVEYRGHAGVDDPDGHDTTWWRSGGPPAEPMVSGLLPEHFPHPIHRDIKPTASIGTYILDGESGQWLPDMPMEAVIEYDMPLGYDRVEPGTAMVLARFEDGHPALTVNRAGQGLAFFWTPVYPGLCHTASEWQMYADRHDFWPHVRELLEAMVHGGLAYGKNTLPVEVSNSSKEIEVTVRGQPEHHRWMVHLLNYDVHLDRVEPSGVTVHPPHDRTVRRMYYPDTWTEVPFTTDANGTVKAVMREFHVHDMLVIEWKP